MSTNGKGPFAGAPQEKVSLKNYRALLAEIKALAPPKGCRWIDEPIRQLLRTAINRAIAGEGRPDVHVLLELDPEAAAKGWTAIRVEAGRWRFLAGISGWTPGVKNILRVLEKLDRAGEPIEEIRDLARGLADIRQARSLLTDGRAAAASGLAKASHSVWRAFGDALAEARDPRNWANRLPPEAQIEGIWFAAMSEDPGDDE